MFVVLIFSLLIAVGSSKNQISIINRSFNAFGELLLFHLPGLRGGACSVVLAFLTESIIVLLFLDTMHFSLIQRWMEI